MKNEAAQGGDGKWAQTRQAPSEWMERMLIRAWPNIIASQSQIAM
jgi:hypothetical protein